MRLTNQAHSLCHSAKRALVSLPLWILLLAGQASAAGITVEVASLGNNVFRYEFTPTGIDLLQYQEIDFRFDPVVFDGLANGIAGGGFRVTLLQPDNPVGAFGDYSVFSLVDHPGMAGPFSVDATSLSGGLPRGLTYHIHQFDSAGLLITATIASGYAGPAASSAPEPGGWAIVLVGLATIGVLRSAKPLH